MPRYKDKLTVKKTDEGKRFFTTAVVTDPIEEDQPYEYTARLGDRWDTIAYKYLGSATRWYEVANANGAIDGSIFIEPGTVIKIPGR
jgi:nucleoid-associated protein YgaU